MKNMVKVASPSKDLDNFDVDDGVRTVHSYAQLKGKPELHKRVMQRVKDAAGLIEDDLSKRSVPKKTGRKINRSNGR